MGLKTRTQFFYGFSIDSTNNKLDFDEGGPELTATLTVGDYTLSEFTVELQKQLNTAGGQTYSVSVDRETRFITISASSNFSLLITSGTNASTSVYSTAGFTGADLSGSNSYTGTAVGTVYTPQFFLDGYLPSTDNKKRTIATRKESASGKVEVVSYGETSEVKMNITLITDIDQGANSDAITTDLSGVQNARDFMDFITDIKPIEFMEDASNPSVFEKLILLTTPESNQGVDYELKELFNRNLPEYFETGRLTFRKL